VAFDQYAQWHPVLSLDATPEQVVIGAEIPAHVSGGDTGELNVTLRIVEVQAPRRLVWEAGSLEAIWVGTRSSSPPSRTAAPRSPTPRNSSALPPPKSYRHSASSASSTPSMAPPCGQ
jgi:hypothetical protein